MCGPGLSRCFLLTAFLAALLPAVGQAAPRDELLRLVPEDVGLCLVVDHLRDHVQAWQKLPWLQRLRQSAIGQRALQAPELQKLLQVDAELQRHLQLSWPQLRDDILGDCAVLAFQHAHTGKAEDDRGLVLVWVRKPDLLARVLDRINQEQKRTGELRDLQERSHKGVTYYLRQEKKRDQYYLLAGSLFAFSGDADTLKHIIDRQQQAAHAAAAAPLVQSFARLPADRAIATLWINARAFDADLEKEQRRARAADAQVMKTLRHYWQALDAAALTLNIDQEIQVQLTLQGRPETLSPAAQQFFRAAALPSELWQFFPAEALLTVTTRLDLSALLDMLEEFMPPAARTATRENLQKSLGAAMGMDFVQDVLPCVGPDFGLCVAAAPDGKPIPHVLLALRLRSGAKETSVDQSLYKTLQFFVGLAVFDHNRRHKDRVRILSVQQEHGEVKYLAAANFPDGFRPAYTLKEGYLLLANMPAAVERFHKSTTTVNHTALAKLSFLELGRWLGEHSPRLMQLLDKSSQISPAFAQYWLQQTSRGLEVLDHLELHQQTAVGQVTWSLRLRPASR